MDNQIDRFAERQKTALLKDKRRFTCRLIILVLCPLSLFLCPSCKQNNWVDWKTQNEMWLEQNKTQPGVQVSPSGLQYRIIADPTPQDARPNTTSSVICDYKLTLINGCQVDAGNMVGMSLANTISGFAEGCHKIHANGDIELFIPAYLAYDQSKYDSGDYYSAEGYGTEGTTGYIPPYSTLIYTVHLCAVLDE